MSEQLVFELPHRPALGADDFLVSKCNREAVRLIDNWPGWPSAIHAISGPAACGKSHLANVWLLKSGARRLELGVLDIIDGGGVDLAKGVLLEDLDRLNFDERALFHLLNLSAERNFYVLLKARAQPANWVVELPDLRSRLRSVPVAAIGPPDDDLLRGALLKQLLDRQLNVEPRVIAYLATRMERSMETVRQLVDALDRASLSARHKITRQFASNILGQMAPR